jgi:ABC-type phosphate transport system substrate-binding protein
MHRSLPLAVATGLAALSLAACTTETKSCKGDHCDIDLQGAGASVTLGGTGSSTVTLVSASGKTAKVKLGAVEGVLTVGQPVPLRDSTIELVKVEGKDDVQIQVKDRPAK